jgi:release factor glutamine methyltransferase
LQNLDARQRALVGLGQNLRDQGYGFVTPTPETHRRVNARADATEARTLRDVFGWSRPFRPGLLSPALLHLCEAANILAVVKAQPDRLISTVRFSTVGAPDLGNLIVAHSAYPTTGPDAVFFGPDSYRFAALLARAVPKAGRLVDIGCGTGVGGLVLAARAEQVVLADINPGALRLAAVNVALAGQDAMNVTLTQSDVLAQVEGRFDTVVANPPYLVDEPGRVYRNGGGALGIDLSVRMVTEGLERLVSGGQLILYTGSPVVEGVPVLASRLAALLTERTTSFRWEELDPDVFGEELEHAAYQTSERIAVVALIAVAG